MEYEAFQKFIYKDMIKEWTKPNKLSYIICKYNIDLICQKDPTITVERIVEDFRKYPLVKEVVMSLGQIVIFPK